MGGQAPFCELAPKLSDRRPNTQSGGGHYFYQDVWALRRLIGFCPKEHHDFGSRLDGFVAQATSICPIVYWDMRAPNFQLPDFSFRQADILKLPLVEDSIRSASCLHVAEHIGLGRYGDPLDPEGTHKALKELQRIVAQGGQLLFSMPIGRERVEFNAQRVWNPMRPIDVLDRLDMQEFSVVADEGVFMENKNPGDFATQKFACGLYLFHKT
jgi:SAM-dependent methyltransferase